MNPLPSRLTVFHHLLEWYTPDSTLGRLGFSLVAALVCYVSAVVFFIGVFDAGVLGSLVGLGGAAVGLSTVGLILLVLWPVYLSVLGHIESADAYVESNVFADAPEPDTTDTEPIDRDEDDPLAVAKRQYAAGNISEAEFARRVETLLEVDREIEDYSRGAADRDLDRDELVDESAGIDLDVETERR